MSTVVSKSSKSSLLCRWCGKNKKAPGAARCRPCQDKINTRQKALRAASRAAGLCTCGRAKPLPGRQACQTCVDEQRVAQQRLKCKNRQQGLCGCGLQPVTGAKTCEHCRGKSKAKNAKLRKRVFEHYGLSCACCGESVYEFLEIDHIDGDGSGNDHRREIGYGAIYRWLIRNNFPPGFQTLCSNCNRAKFRYGVCPHQRHKEAT